MQHQWFGADASVVQAMINGTYKDPVTNVRLPSVTTTLPDGRIINEDPYSKLYAGGILRLSGQFEDGMADVMTTLLLNHEATSKNDAQMYINSPGGVVTSGLGIIDTMNYIKNDVSTIVVGQAASMGAATLVAGAPGKRFALPNARIMVHQIRGGSQGTLDDMEIQIEEARQLNEILFDLFVERTGQSRDTVKDWFRKDTFFRPSEAVKAGIIDKVITPNQLQAMQAGDS
ncbi:MAG: ATP-dependent Clp protease proteolytic subunit [Pseudomonadota bacterium]|nr:ATP-dependent Clp protease proteolytic subunit [Pseudomonadota bacterium]